MAPSITITGTVTDALGSIATFNTSASIDSISIVSITVTPQTAPNGTTRKLSVSATSSSNAAITFNAPVATGIVFTAVPNMPAGLAAWTFVY